MDPSLDYLSINKASWNKRAEVHYDSDFYDNDAFISGKNSLNDIELDLLGDVKGQSALHLQCHFGQDTISLSRMGAKAVGVDFSEVAVEKARKLADITQQDASFICSDVYGLTDVLDETFDIVFSSYGTIGWLPDIRAWGQLVARYLRPGGRFIFAEFHPVVWMFDDDFTKVSHRYFQDAPIVEQMEGSYTDRNAPISAQYVSWNHGLGEVLSSLLEAGLEIKAFREYDYSPYNCLNGMEEIEAGRYRIQAMGNKIPLVYAIEAHKPS
ncbi:MAG: class I SAM-dependent methyltransferase [Bacteroidota bacterium]